jgi:hypothetical protein
VSQPCLRDCIGATAPCHKALTPGNAFADRFAVFLFMITREDSVAMNMGRGGYGEFATTETVLCKAANADDGYIDTTGTPKPNQPPKPKKR